MLRHYTLGDDIGLDDGDVDPTLLHQTQAFLRAGKRGISADPRLLGAWHQFYKQFDPFIRSVISTRVPQGADREDCLQDAWRDIVAGLPAFRRDPSRCVLRTWLFTVAHHKAADYVRRRARGLASRLSDDWIEALPGAEPDPALDYERRRRQLLVRRALAMVSLRLSEQNQRLLCLRWVEERSVKETAAILKLSPQRIRLRDHRLRRLLRQILMALDPEPGEPV